jgi:uncharacterized membrane protein YGL010W
MKPLAEQMAMYAAYHRNPRNRATHFIGVPAIAFAILIPMAWASVRLGDARISLAMVFTAGVLIYYLALDRPLALASALLFIPMLIAAEWVAAQGNATGLWTFAAFFVGGWVFQLIGHVWEGRKPALADNLMQIFVAPLFLMVEAAQLLGLRRDLQAAVAARMPDYLPRQT